ncbi:MAG: hypothetical protein AB7K24_17240, partial [Gemmataceae bacterium]
MVSWPVPAHIATPASSVTISVRGGGGLEHLHTFWVRHPGIDLGIAGRHVGREVFEDDDLGAVVARGQPQGSAVGAAAIGADDVRRTQPVCESVIFHRHEGRALAIGNRRSPRELQRPPPHEAAALLNATEGYQGAMVL